MSYGVACLLSKEDNEALNYAQILDNFNQERKYVEADMQQEAFITLDKLADKEIKKLPIGLCLYEQHWHPGVIGILAARIKERFHRPVIIFANSTNGEIKGSARSIPGLHIRDVLADIAAQSPNLYINLEDMRWLLV
jgi:single-stranded-DNA-specific exonuclease